MNHNLMVFIPGKIKPKIWSFWAYALVPDRYDDTEIHLIDHYIKSGGVMHFRSFGAENFPKEIEKLFICKYL